MFKANVDQKFFIQKSRKPERIHSPFDRNGTYVAQYTPGLFAQTEKSIEPGPRTNSHVYLILESDLVSNIRRTETKEYALI